jgi:CheY-like chemotaxis protein
MVKEKSEKCYLTPIEATTTPGGHRRYLRHSVERFAQERGLNYVDPNDGELRILVVDDDRQFADYLVELLSGQSDTVTVTAVYDGFSAGTHVHSFRPDVLLLDLMMPGINGFDVCKLVKGNAETNYIRILAMTALPTDENVARIMEAGAEVCFSKPIDSRLLLTYVDLAESKESV